MPELDPFEMRLQTAVRALADRADTSVDAVLVANETIGRRRRPWLGWPGLPLPVGVPVLVLLALLLAVLAWTLQVGAPWTRLTVTPTPTPAAPPTTASTPSVGVADGPVFGTGTLSIVNPGTAVDVAGFTQVRGFVATTIDTLNDPRVSGSGTLRLSLDTQGAVGTEWGTYRLETGDGAWEGSLAGGAWAGGDARDLAGYLVGSGAYAGFTYYLHVRSSGVASELDGIVFPGTPPGQ